MKPEPDEKGMIDGALLGAARTPESRAQIVELILENGRLAMIKRREEHLTVHFMVKQSGKPQWCIDFWGEHRTSSITDTLEHARKLADEFVREGAEPADGPDRK